MAENGKPLLVTVQVLRAVAALGVVFYHVHIIGGQRGFDFGAFIGRWAEVGRMGVSLFFVLSGFIICFAHRRDIGAPDRLGRYCWKRFARIYPTYWIFSLLYVSAALAGLGDSDFIYDSGHILSAVTLLPFVESPLPPLLVAWTLFYEVKFYLAFGVLIWNRALGIGVFVVWLVYLAASYRFGLADPFRLWTLWNAHFFLGCGAYWLYRRFGQSGVGQGMSGQVPALGAIGLGLGGLALSVALTDFRLEPIDGSNNEVVVLIALSFALVIAGMARADALLAPWCGRGLRYLGDASYSLYLVHSAVISLCFIVAARVPALARLDPVLTYFGVAVLAVAGGCMAHSLVERPLLRFVGRFAPARGNRGTMAVPA